MLTESGQRIRVEGNQHFPAESHNIDYFIESPAKPRCPRKGRGNYYAFTVGEAVRHADALLVEMDRLVLQRAPRAASAWPMVLVQVGDGIGADLAALPGIHLAVVSTLHREARSAHQTTGTRGRGHFGMGQTSCAPSRCRGSDIEGWRPGRTRQPRRKP